MVKNTIQYPEEFKVKCFNYLRHYMDIRLLTSALDNNRDTIVRYYLEEALEDSALYVEKITEDEDRRIVDAKKHAYKQRQDLYNEYMELLTETIDKENVRSKLLR
jgi:hypothetical protein|tara:strand:+ start:3219 stop:3533 length:315 start_codon:yes stop_codon:yes gene_type:complete